MSNLSLLISADAKLSRAREHWATFEAEVAQFLAQRGYRFGLDIFPSQQQMVLKHWLDNEAPPPVRLSVLAGDFLFNLRSTLDHVVCALARLNTRTVPCSGTAFPISTDAATYAKVRDKVLKGVPADAQKVIDSLQPFAEAGPNASTHPLSILNKLCNADKHRVLNFTTSYTKSARFRIYYPQSTTYYEFELDAPISSGESRTLPLPKGVGPGMTVATDAQSVVIFHNSEPWARGTVGEVLFPCLTHVETNVMPTLRSFFV